MLTSAPVDFDVVTIALNVVTNQRGGASRSAGVLPADSLDGWVTKSWQESLVLSLTTGFTRTSHVCPNLRI
jgi:hypothetical protein